MNMSHDKAITIAQNIIVKSIFAVLGTQTDDGFPYTSLTQIVIKENTPYMLLSDLSDHTKNIEDNNHISLFFDGTQEINKMNSPRISIMGFATKVDKSELQELFYSSHPKTKLYYNFGDFGVWKLDMERAKLNAGFGDAFDFSKHDLK